MIVKFFRGGRTKSGARSAVNYLLNERVATGEAQIFKGDPDLTLKIINQIDNKWKFSSGVISFSELENTKITDEMLEEVIKEFERTFFPGFNEDEYNILWVKHTDKKRTELHFIAPRIYLKTWKAYNPYLHKKDLKKKDLFQDYINRKYNLFSPKMFGRYATKHEKNWSSKLNDLKKEINEWVEYAIEKGLVEDRNDIIELLEEAGFEITRKGKNYISVKLPEMKKAIRLKGVVYEEAWRIGGSYQEERARDIRKLHRDIGEIRAELERQVERDIRYNRSRYKRSNKGDGRKVARRSDLNTQSKIYDNLFLGNDNRDNIDNRDILSIDNELSSKLRQQKSSDGLQLEMEHTQRINNKELEYVRKLIARIRETRELAREALAGLERAIEQNRGEQQKNRLFDALFFGFQVTHKNARGAVARAGEAVKELEREREAIERSIQQLDRAFVDLTEAISRRRERINRLRERVERVREEIETIEYARRRRVERVVTRSRGMSR